MNIAISGLHGTGKTTIAKKIAEIFNLTHYSTGFFFREIAKERNLSLEELSKKAEEDKTIDYELDTKIKEYAKKGNCVLDNQLSPFLIPDLVDYKILLKCDTDVRISRMSHRDNENLDEKKKETIIREDSEHKRFIDYYNVDIRDAEKILDIFDLILDTTKFDIQSVTNIVKNAIEIYQKL